ncbi:MAG: siderophore-interacting protein [Myxococcales bacterium]|nr:MAG: siderophore-interacting protein [Myxococcales bacterium]
MTRVSFGSPELHDFLSDAPDDHVKLFFADGPRTVMRDFTPRSFDAARRTLVVDFALHEQGPASSWAREARVGARLEVAGPRGSLVIPDDFDWYLLVGDESALPAIGRRVEELRPGVPVTTIVAVHATEDEQRFETRAQWSPLWLHRGRAEGDARLLVDAVARLTFPPGDGLVWIAGESGLARALRDHIVKERQHPAAWTKAAAYWKRGGGRRARAHRGLKGAGSHRAPASVYSLESQPCDFAMA